MSERNFVEMLKECWRLNRSVCVGLDSDCDQIPIAAQKESVEKTIFYFNCAIIDATKDLVCAYKPNIAFYEQNGLEGLSALIKTTDYIRTSAPEIPIILDAKRGDIGNTNKGYVQAAFETYGVDAITVHPYLGREALQPFLDQKNKGIIVLCRTSNPGAGEFQDFSTGWYENDVLNLIVDKAPKIDGNEIPLWAYVAASVTLNWNENGNCGLVVGATYPEELEMVRKIVDDMPILIPGIGAQGGDIEKTVNAGADINREGMIINSSRGIIFASKGPDFAETARAETKKLNDLISHYRFSYKKIKGV
jgi:orotidine-5'-phosphate decarboxylase